MTIHTWLSFLIASILISLTPGAGAVSSMSSGLSYGFKRGIWNALGLQLALAVQLIVVAAGLGALLATSDLAFTVIKWFGVAYLIYLAYRQWTAPISPGRECSDEAGSSPMVSRSHLFWRGFVINASNPKAILFILAVVPQFLNIENALGMQYFVLGLTMVVVDLLVMGGYTTLATRLRLLFRQAIYLKRLNKIFGSMFGLAAALLATVRRI